MEPVRKRAFLLMLKDVGGHKVVLRIVALVVGGLTGYLTQFYWFNVLGISLVVLMWAVLIGVAIKEWYDDRTEKAREQLDSGGRPSGRVVMGSDTDPRRV